MGEYQTQPADYPHVAVCPSAGIAHLIPFLRVASMLSSSNCRVTLMTIRPTLSSAESNQISTLLSTHPHIHSLDVELPLTQQPPPVNPNNADVSITTKPTASPDPFFPRYTAISQSAHLLARHLITLDPPPTAVISDIMLTAGFNETLGEHGIPNYVLPITSAMSFTFTTHLAYLNKPLENSKTGNVEDEVLDISSSIDPIPKSVVPPPFYNPNHIFTKMLFRNSASVHKCKGIVFNSFNSIEPEIIKFLQGSNGAFGVEFPPVYPIGPLKKMNDPLGGVNGNKSSNDPTEWLDKQPSESVVYVNFGSRTPLSKDQILELRDGLDASGVRFLWVVKTTEVDKDEKGGLVELLGEAFTEKIAKSQRGLVFKEWVDQDAVLSHPSVGGFVTHCGWNSVLEAVERGLPLLGWPLHGDQRGNALAVEKAGLGIWAKWGWIGERLVKGDEIAEKIKEVMMDERLRNRAKKLCEEASKAWKSDNGSSSSMISKLILDISQVK